VDLMRIVIDITIRRRLAEPKRIGTLYVFQNLVGVCGSETDGSISDIQLFI